GRLEHRVGLADARRRAEVERQSPASLLDRASVLDGVDQAHRSGANRANSNRSSSLTAASVVTAPSSAAPTRPRGGPRQRSATGATDARVTARTITPARSALAGEPSASGSSSDMPSEHVPKDI